MAGGPGNGPICPLAPWHGRTYSVDPGGNPVKGFRCMHRDHGGNGRKFTDKEAHGELELEEKDVALAYESAAHEIIAGRLTLDQAVQQAAKATGRSSAQVREALTLMIDTIQEKDTDMAEKKKAAAAAKATKPAKQAGERRRLEHVDGDRFKAVLDEFGLSNKQAAEATGAAGMGASPTYIYILTHQGSSVKLFGRFESAIKDYAKANKIKRVKVAAAPTAAPEPEPELAEGVVADDNDQLDEAVEEPVAEAVEA